MAKVSRPFTAKYKGKCPKCNQYWLPGEALLNYVDGVLQHVNCSTPALPEQITHSQSYKTSLKSSSQTWPPLDIESNPVDIDALGDALSLPEPVREKSNFVPSKYQQDFFDALFAVVEKRYTYLHIVLEAVAGSGKTTTLIHGIERLIEKFPSLSICIVAFNKHIADEFTDKLHALLGYDNNVIASTKHSLGYSAIRKTYPKAQVDRYNDKLNEYLDSVWEVSKAAIDAERITKEQQRKHYIKRASLRNLVSICKNTLTNYEDQNALLSVIDRFNIEIDADSLDEVLSKLPAAMQYCKDDPLRVAFDDMGWLPIVLDLDIEKFDILMIDEAQDMSKGDMEFLFRCVKENGSIIAVGDRFQSLYGFRGADTDAIPNTIEMLKAQTLPLSVTYRCPTSHVMLAQEIVPQLEARDNAPEGAVIDIEYLDLVKELQIGDMVICRTNAPLVKPAFECIRAGKKAMIRGMEVGDSLINLIKRFETNDLSQFEISLAEYFELEFTKFMNKGKELQAAMLRDKVDTLRFIMSECNTVADLLNKIKMLFSDKVSGVVFSSVHRAKGLEADRVFLLRPDLMPHPKAKQSWEQQQEINAKYVALTRSKRDLYFVKGGENV